MRIVAGLAAFVVLSAIPAAAQYSPLPTSTIPDAMNSICVTESQPQKDKKDGKAPAVTECRTVVEQGCPVDMRVRQRMGGTAVAVDANGVKRKVLAQKLRLFLNSFRPDPGARKPVSAVVRVHGTGDEPRMRTLGSVDVNSSAMLRTFRVNLETRSEPGASGDFLLPGFTSASQVDLVSVTYDDGSTWRLGQNESCRVAVDPMMLINR
jgi:hypothetical protein